MSDANPKQREPSEKDPGVYQRLRRRQVDRAITEIPTHHLTSAETEQDERSNLRELGDLGEQRRAHGDTPGLTHMPDSDGARRAAAFARDSELREPAEKPPGSRSLKSKIG